VVLHILEGEEIRQHIICYFYPPNHRLASHFPVVYVEGFLAQAGTRYGVCMREGKNARSPSYRMLLMLAKGEKLTHFNCLVPAEHATNRSKQAEKGWKKLIAAQEYHHVLQDFGFNYFKHFL
jgi:hypothetical protein